MKRIKILIIEDETVLALHISSFLNAKGYITFTSSNAKESLQIMEDESIDLIVSDINIKGDIDGITTCKTIQNIYDTPTIYLTAYKDKQTLQRASETNFLGYLLKPFREDELEVLLELLIAKLGLSDKDDTVCLDNDYSFDKKTNRVFHNNEELSLTSKEKQLFTLLLNRKNSIVSFEIIEETLWNAEPVSDTTRRQLIFRLRQKLANLNIENIKSLGLRLNLS